MLTVTGCGAGGSFAHPESSDPKQNLYSCGVHDWGVPLPKGCKKGPAWCQKHTGDAWCQAHPGGLEANGPKSHLSWCERHPKAYTCRKKN